MSSAFASTRTNGSEVVKELAFFAVVALLMSVMILGVETVDRPTGLELAVRWDLVLIAIGSTVVGRFALIMRREGMSRIVQALLITVTAVAVFEMFVRFRDMDDRWASPVVLDMAFGSVLSTVVAIAFVAIVFAIAYFSMKEKGAVEVDESAKLSSKIQLVYRSNTKKIGLVGIIFFIIFPFLFGENRSAIDLATLVMIYIMLGWGLNIVVGLAGLLDLGYVAFYAVGAYSYALLSQNFDLSFWLCLPLAGIFAASFGIILGFPVLRLRGDYLAIVTLGFGEIIRVVLINWYDLTGGPDGISSIERPSFFGLADFSRRVPEGSVAFSDLFGMDYSSMHRLIFLYYLILALALVTNFVTMRLRKLPIGRAWEALREDEIACRSLGINPTNTKLSAFAIGAMFGGFAGAFFATRQGFISPESFTFLESAVILAIVVLGGMGSQIGVVLAAIVMIGFPEMFRELAEYRMLIFGAGIVAIMLWRPRGLLSFRDPTILLNMSQKEKVAGELK
ncbi:high-affinity branched-chain amino acid ABC transporter permease LivM [Thalassospira povalilytica]|uniref:High-affinity branched-chain amino acid ABC transporter permease LivM n=4 Tax=Thalassospira TaxID=168934 RepID=A0A8I1M925_9PROT|nr:high-affinity branched-chain amino acid ABC transporter permease LivM [Thalassospira povalilytica]MBN8197386.1 high-affinity branched-chain amino acid ABC transporter permease LivM [Thalassospira povalilytica]MCC4240783.1 high-affinity branched-chain amino acid ABC transporter permease LivM [Thalassospira povalilytica]MEE3044531.1 high-affinity branched-chain amino acid ABC transporter permease LivM [Pseudomonadota bacterium]RCK24943.1 ABC transporter permease [Thalassospira profundimaris]|tara:strand:+ start:2109 stop:3629 length:1521 start_codon:yes stop_codon:yes gene_type:complete